MSGAFSIPLAIVSEISGTVLARSRDGAYRFLRKGDGVYESDVLITENNSSLRLQSENGVFLDMRGGTEVVLNIDLFIDRHCAGEEDASSFSAGEAAHVPMASIKEAVLKSDIVNRGIHGYLRVARISDDPEHASYLFTSYTGDYDATFDGRTAIGNLFSDGRATTDPRIVMSTSTLTFTQVETSSRITPVTSGFSEKRFHADSDDIPAAVNDEYSVSQGGSLMIIAPGILSNDSIGSDGGALSVVSHTNPGHGTLMLNADGSFTYTPDADYHGPDSYTYTIRDADGDTSTAAVSVTVTPIEDDPKANPDMNSVKVNNTIIVGVSNGVILSGGNPAGLDTDPDGDSLTVIGFTTGKAGSTTEAGSSGVGVSIAGAYGHLALHADGSYSYSADTESSRALAPGETAEDIFSYAISDGNGGSSFTTLTITVTGTAPDEQLVNEDALTNPPNLSEGESEFTGDVSSVTGSLAALFADSGSSGTRHYMVESGTSAGDPDPLVHTATGNTLLSKGVGVHYTTDSSGTVLSGYADVDGDGSYTGGMDRVVFTLTVDDASTGAYTFALNDQVDHPANGDAGTLSLDLAPYVSLTEAAGERVTAASGLVFVLENDVPSAKENVQEMTVKPIDTNLTIMLDCSESMWFNDPEGLAFDAARNLVDEYDELGDVRVQIILFGENAEVRSVWVGPDEAGAILDALDPENSYNQSWTNYDVALVKMMEIYGNEGRLSTPATQNVSYFISDGQPNRPEGSAGIDGSEEAQWEAFLETNGIDSYALGIGTVISLDALQPVAYNGSSGTERDAVLVPDVNDLSGVLSDTVVPGTVTGTLIGSSGADEAARVVSITIDGTTYTYDPEADGSIAVNGTDRSAFDAATDTLTITTLGFGDDLSVNSKLVVNMESGEYTYYAPRTVVNESFTDTFSFLICDRDGDHSTAASSITVNPPLTGTTEDHTADRSDYITGLADNDILCGNTGDEVLDGGAGKTPIPATAGGWDGIDTLLFTDGAVTDFNAPGYPAEWFTGSDIIALLSDASPDSISFLDAADVMTVIGGIDTLSHLRETGDCLPFTDRIPVGAGVSMEMNGNTLFHGPL